jgi:hypothetical protein
MLAIKFLDDGDSRRPTSPNQWMAYVPLVVGVAVGWFGLGASVFVSAMGFAVALTVLFAMSASGRISRTYLAFSAVILTTIIGFNVFNYFALDIGKDSLGYLCVAAEILRTGKYSLFQPSQDSYYWPFPIMAIASSSLSAVTGLDLLVSEFIFPGILIPLQPLFVFLLSRRLFKSVRAAALSAVLVATTSVLTQWIVSPLAESTALSLLLLFLLLRSCDRTTGNRIAAYAVFITLVALHGAVGLLSIALIAYLRIRHTVARSDSIVPAAAIFTGYLVLTSLINIILFKLANVVTHLFFLRVESPGIFPLGSGGLIFLWWGLPVALGMMSIVMRPKGQVSTWAFAGLGVLGMSFVANVLTPSLMIDRYVGLTAWLILCASGGKTLSILTRHPRQLRAFVPIILLVSLSAVVYPPLSPQYGFGSPASLPTTQADRAALDWISSHGELTVAGDGFSMSYLLLKQYESGAFSIDSKPIEIADPALIIHSLPGVDRQIFVRWSNAGLNPNESGYLIPAILANAGHQTVNIVYNSGCAILMAAK